MHRVGRRHGVIAAYVWDFAAGRATSWPLTRGMCQIGMELPKVPGSEDSSIETLRSLFERADFETVTTRPIRRLIDIHEFRRFLAFPNLALHPEWQGHRDLTRGRPRQIG